ncbi:MAG TPA: phosphatase PAP2 family protein [Fibrobacteraceae bacterium]|nr:phosphatase PAP2 family protein [Fibrobacteraceae bacterium]
MSLKGKLTRLLICLLLLLSPLNAETAGGAYGLSWRKDVSLSLAGLGIFAVGQWRISHMEAYDGTFDKSDLFPWDRPFAGTWNVHADLASDILSGTGVFPVAIALAGWHQGDLDGNDVATQVLMLFEALSLQSGINLCVRSLRVWPRPLMLGDQGGSERDAADASGSFYSGHSSAAFTIAVFSGTWFQHTYPHSRWIPWVWTGTLTLATLTAALRVAAGKHYPTDVVTGALIGSFIGWIVPRGHLVTHPTEQQTWEFALAPLPGGAQLQMLF